MTSNKVTWPALNKKEMVITYYTLNTSFTEGYIVTIDLKPYKEISHINLKPSHGHRGKISNHVPKGVFSD